MAGQIKRFPDPELTSEEEVVAIKLLATYGEMYALSEGRFSELFAGKKITQKKLKELYFTHQEQIRKARQDLEKEGRACPAANPWYLLQVIQYVLDYAGKERPVKLVRQSKDVIREIAGIDCTTLLNACKLAHQISSDIAAREENRQSGNQYYGTSNGYDADEDGLGFDHDADPWRLGVNNKQDADPDDEDDLGFDLTAEAQ